MVLGILGRRPGGVLILRPERQNNQEGGKCVVNFWLAKPLELTIEHGAKLKCFASTASGLTESLRGVSKKNGYPGSPNDAHCKFGSFLN